MIYLISDTHLFHKNIIEYDELPFTDTLEMNTEIIDSWNRTVSVLDTVFFLGDFALTNRKISNDKIENLIRIYKNLNGNKIFIKGNHDGSKFKDALLEAGQEVFGSFSITPLFIKERLAKSEISKEVEDFLREQSTAKIHMIHNPMPFVTSLKENDFLCYGHLHRLQMEHNRTFNVGWCNHMKPVSINHIIKEWQSKLK